MSPWRLKPTLSTCHLISVQGPGWAFDWCREIISQNFYNTRTSKVVLCSVSGTVLRHNCTSDTALAFHTATKRWLLKLHSKMSVWMSCRDNIPIIHGLYYHTFNVGTDCPFSSATQYLEVDIVLKSTKDYWFYNTLLLFKGFYRAPSRKRKRCVRRHTVKMTWACNDSTTECSLFMSQYDWCIALVEYEYHVKRIMLLLVEEKWADIRYWPKSIDYSYFWCLSNLTPVDIVVLYQGLARVLYFLPRTVQGTVHCLVQARTSPLNGMHAIGYFTRAVQICNNDPSHTSAMLHAKAPKIHGLLCIPYASLLHSLGKWQKNWGFLLLGMKRKSQTTCHSSSNRQTGLHLKSRIITLPLAYSLVAGGCYMSRLCLNRAADIFKISECYNENVANNHCCVYESSFSHAEAIQNRTFKEIEPPIGRPTICKLCPGGCLRV